MAEKLYTCYETSQTMSETDWFLFYLRSDEIDKTECRDFSEWWHDMRKSGVIEVAWNNYFKGGISMYLFEAHYINMDTNEKVIRKIEFDGQFFDSEKEIYLYAMGKAYDMIEDNECFDILEFIAC